MVKGQIEARLDSAVSDLRAKGYAVELSDRWVSGFPFRMRVSFGPVKLSSTSGWGVSAPAFQAQAYLHDLTHWVLVAPKGLTVVRPKGGPLSVTGTAIRASVAGLTHSPWRVAMEGTSLVFTPDAAAKPFYLDRADRFEAYLRPARDQSGDGEFLLRLEGARPRPHTIAWNLAPDAPVHAELSGRIADLRAARGGDWRSAVAAWAAAGGQLRFEQGSAQGGATAIRILPSAVSVNPNGLLEGGIALRLNQTPELLETAEGAQPVPPQPPADGGVPFNFVFHDGKTRLGPVELGPAPRVFGSEPAAADRP